MASFDLYAPLLRELEGGFVDHPADEGGPTKAGVTLAAFRATFGQDKTVNDLKNMTDAQWKKIMRIYWDACSADKITSQAVANIVVDWNINSGISGRRGVQNTFGLAADGIFGPKTLAALNKEPHRCVFCKIKTAREQFYHNLVEKKPSQKVFLKGWLNRLNRFSYEGE